MRSRWAATVALAAMVVLLASCSSKTVALNPTPTLSAVFPDTRTAGGPAFTLNLIGTNFLSTSQVFWNGSCVQAVPPNAMPGNCAPVTFNASTQQLSVTVPAINIAIGGSGSSQIMVVNPPAGNPPVGGGASNSITFPIIAPNNPVPTITSLSQQSAPAGGAGFGLMVNGTNFISTSAVNFDGSPRTTSVNSATQLTAVIFAQDLLCAGVDHITVTNPAPGGGNSNSVEFDVTPLSNTQPCITALSPASANAGAAGFPLTLSGTNFNANSSVKFGANARVTTFNPATGQLTASLLAADLANPGNVNVTVVNTIPVAGSSAPFSFTINAAASSAAKPDRNTFPLVISISASGGPADGPSSAPAMSADGRFVAFFSNAKNLVAEGASGNILVRDTCLGASSDCTPHTIAVDLAPDGSAPHAAALAEVALSSDGRFVAFTSMATNLSGSERLYPEGVTQVYVRDSCLGSGVPTSCIPHTDLVSIGTNGLPGRTDSSSPSISANGRFVAFVSLAEDLSHGGQPGTANLFVRDTCSDAKAANSCGPQTVLVATPTNAHPDPLLIWNPKISGDGRYIAFEMWARESIAKWLGAEDAVTPSDILVVATCLGETVPKECIRSSTIGSLNAGGVAIHGHNESPSISSDGRFVVFQSQSVDVNSGERIGAQQILLRDTCFGLTARSGCTPSSRLIDTVGSAPPGIQDGFSPFISSSGRYVAFVMGHVGSSNRSDPVTAGFLFVQDTCFGPTTDCTPSVDAATIPGASSHSAPLVVDTVSTVRITANGRFAVFVSTPLTEGAPSSDRKDILLTVTTIK